MTLKVKTVIGTGDPSDGIMLIPLIADWGVPRECVWNVKERCEGRLRRLYVLEEPLDGHRVVGVCEEHHALFAGKHKQEVAT